MTPLTPDVIKIAQLFFQEQDLTRVLNALESECGTNLPLCQDSTPESLERLRFAAIKVSKGEMGLFREAIDLAKLDWRDLLVWAGFANNIHEHQKWAESVTSVH
jgi:hypothetical protein